jgi:hypothetical protein
MIAASAALPALAQDKYPGIGRAATAKEVAAWDIDVRPDFKGLPPGSGTVARGQDLWEEQAAPSATACSANPTPSSRRWLAAPPQTTSRPAASPASSAATTPAAPRLMKVPTVSTLWDYIHRAMPWDEPKSLKPDEVYAVTAFLLNLGHVVPDNFTLSDKNIAEVQQKMPNRNGMTTAHALWPGKELPGGQARPDVQAKACMSNCGPAPAVTSVLPEHARDNARQPARAKPHRRPAARLRHHQARRLAGRRRRAGQGGRPRQHRQPQRRRHRPDAEARLHRLPRHERQAGRPQLRRHRRQARRQGRLPGRQDQGRWLRRLGRNSHAAAGTCPRPTCKAMAAWLAGGAGK